MITIPVAIWTVYNALNCIGAAMKEGESRISFALALGVAALSCGLLSAGAYVQFLSMEITLWIFNMGIALIAAAVRPPGIPGSDINRLAVHSAIRLTLAMIVWLCI